MSWSVLNALSTVDWARSIQLNGEVTWARIVESLSTGFILKSLALSSSHPCVFASVFLTFVPLYFSFFQSICVIHVSLRTYTLCIHVLSVFACVFPTSSACATVFKLKVIPSLVCIYFCITSVLQKFCIPQIMCRCMYVHVLRYFSYFLCVCLFSENVFLLCELA